MEKPGPQKLTRDEFFQAFLHRYSPVLGADLCLDIIESAHNVEGGYCWEEIMTPYAWAMYGPNVFHILKGNF